MLRQKFALYFSLLLMSCSSTAMAAPLLDKKYSTLPCLFNQPNFAERLIQSSPWVTEQTPTYPDIALLRLTPIIKLPAKPIYIDELRLGPAHNLWRQLDFISKNLDATSAVNFLWEGSVYFDQFTALYFGGLNNLMTYALVLGDGKRFSGIHISIGQFPIHFGSGFSEYPLASPFEALLGVGANKRAISIYKAQDWNIAHKTKIRLFGCLGEKWDSPIMRKEGNVTTEKLEKYSGFNVHHEWTSAFGEVAIGLSTISGLPIEANKKKERHRNSGVDLYAHINKGAWKFKVEGVSGSILEHYIKPYLTHSTSKAKKAIAYAGHVEVAYKLPIKQDTTVVFGCTGIEEEPGKRDGKQRIFGGLKTTVLYVPCIIGIQRETLIGKKSSESVSSSKAESSNTLHAQLNVTI